MSAKVSDQMHYNYVYCAVDVARSKLTMPVNSADRLKEQTSKPDHNTASAANSSPRNIVSLDVMEECQMLKNTTHHAQKSKGESTGKSAAVMAVDKVNRFQ